MGDSGFQVGIYGLGLIGGSVALAVRKFRPEARIIGYGRNAAKLEQAVKNRLVHESADERSPVTRTLDVFLIATPVDTIAPVFSRYQDFLPETVLVMDAASVKRRVMETVSKANTRGLKFVGTHPMAGSEKTGPESANADLFAGRVVVLTGNDPADVLKEARGFWENLGAKTVITSPEDHDGIVALTSHLPHLSAAALVSILAGDKRSAALFQGIYGRGLLDSTRIAQGDPGMWADIVLANGTAIADALDTLSGDLKNLAGLIRRSDRTALVGYLSRSKSFREKLS